MEKVIKGFKNIKKAIAPSQGQRVMNKSMSESILIISYRLYLKKKHKEAPCTK